MARFAMPNIAGMRIPAGGALPTLDGAPSYAFLNCRTVARYDPSACGERLG